MMQDEPTIDKIIQSQLKMDDELRKSTVKNNSLPGSKKTSPKTTPR